MVDRGENLFKAIVVDDDPTICEFVTAIAVNHGLAVYRTRFLGHKFVSCGGPE